MKKSSYIISLLFLIAIFGAGIYNMRRIAPVILNNYRSNQDYKTDLTNNIENDYRQNFVKRSKFIEGYGIVQKVMQRRILGNVEFIRENDDMMNATGRVAFSDMFISEMSALKQILDEKDIPLLYVQMPVRESYDSSVSMELNNTQDNFLRYAECIKDMGISAVVGNDLLEGDGDPSFEEFYFKTDIHPTTKGEIWVANKIAEKLDEEFGVEITGLIQENDSRFIKLEHEFEGNLIKSLGKYFVGTDVFEEYIPNEQPQYDIKNFCSGYDETGRYEDVVMNGMQNGIYDRGTYWVTNYLRYGLPYYNINNLDSDGPNLMIICDSFSYRTISYLSLQCSNITVVDPRFYGQGEGNPIIDAINQYEYDCVIYIHGGMGITSHSMFEN